MHRLLKDDFSVVLYDRKGITQKTLTEHTWRSSRVFESGTIFYAVPIPVFEQMPP